MSRLTELLRGVRWTGGTALVRLAVGLLRLAILSRLLSQTDFGLMAATLLVLSIGQVFAELGISVAIISNRTAPESAYSSLYLFSLLVALGIYGGLLLLSDPAALYFEAPRLRTLLPIVGLVVPIQALAAQHRSLLLKRLHFAFVEQVELGVIGIGFVVAVGAAVAGWGVYALVAALLAESLLATVCLCWRGFRILRYRWRLSWSELQPFLQVGVYAAGGQLLNTLNQQLDVLVIGRVLGLDRLGVYNVLKGVAVRPMRLLNPIISKVSGPILAEQQRERSRLGNNYLRVLRVIGALQLPGYVWLMLAGPLLIRGLLGAEYVPDAPVFAGLAAWFGLRSLVNPVGTLVVATGATRLEFWFNALQTLTLPLLLWSVANDGLLLLSYALAGYTGVLLVLVYGLIVRPITALPFRRYVTAFLPGLTGVAVLCVGYVLTGVLWSGNAVLGQLLQLSIGALSLGVFYLRVGRWIDDPLYRRIRDRIA